MRTVRCTPKTKRKASNIKEEKEKSGVFWTMAVAPPSLRWVCYMLCLSLHFITSLLSPQLITLPASYQTAGLRFGATSAAGVDVDGDALRSAQRNCALNGLKVDLFHAGPTEEEHRGAAASGEVWSAPADTMLHGRLFDAAVANILAPVLIQLAPRLAAYTKPGGAIALSGVLAFQAEAVMAAFEPFFDNVRVEDEEGGWVLIAGVRRLCSIK